MNVLGLMSGTSADGIDVVLCAIEGSPPNPSVRYLGGRTYVYRPEQREQILKAYQPETSRVDTLCLLNAEIGEWFAHAALTLLNELNQQADLIASHGQTVWHEVDRDGQARATLQIGEACVIAERTQITTIHNFRPRDIAAGGQGAPLVGYVDWLLLRHDTHWRAIQNIGGIANVTLLPPLSAGDVDPIAFDTGPGNALVDAVVSEITAGTQQYDVDGAIASRGQIDEAWLSELMTHEYFTRRLPKTTGREVFGTPLALKCLVEGRKRGLSDESIVTTLTAWTAASITDAYRHYAPEPIAEIIVGGGGVHNITLMRVLQEMSGIPVLSHENVGMSSDYKEALAFAVLGYETWHNRIGCLPVQTGATHASVLGQITPGNNYAQLSATTWSKSACISE